MQADLFLAPVRPTAAVPDLGLRPYQQGAREAVAAVWQRSRGALVCLPTGTGKSRTAGAIVWDRKMAGGKTLILCPTIVLCRQMYSDMRNLGLTCAIEQADNRAQRPLPDVTVASVSSMRGERLRTFKPGDFQLVIADEAHRSVSDQYNEIFSHFADAQRLGLTATPERSDGLSLANVFDELAYEMSMLDAIRDGWLVPLRFKTAITDFDAKKLRTLAGEVDPGSVAREIVRSGLLHEAANTLAELAEGERTVAFLPTVASSKAFVGELSARGVKAAHIDGSTPELARAQAFSLFKTGDVRVLSNVGVLTEGWDAPHASVIALLNPTKSRSRLTQMIGRGTRLCDGKTSALVIDFCPGRLKKGRLASPADALAGKMLPDNVHDNLDREGDLAEAITKAEKTAEEIQKRKQEAEEAAKRKAEQVERLKLEAKKRAFVFGVEDHDAHSILGGYGDPNTKIGRVAVGELTPDEKRRKAGLCSLKQAKILYRHGLNPNLNWRLAKKAIDAIAANDWHAPPEVLNNKAYQV